MKRLIVKKLIIVSQNEKKARVIEFDEKLNIITSFNANKTTDNRTGKSLVIKSIYYALGAKLKKYTANWTQLKIDTIITFVYDGTEYELFRSKERFILKSNNDIKYFSSIGELKEFYVDFFNFHLRIPPKKGGTKPAYAYPGAIFMPFYIDQDNGWSGTWDSFGDIFNAQWKSESLLYHIGVRNKEYYDLTYEKLKLTKEQKEFLDQLKAIDNLVSSHTKKYKDYLDISLTTDDFLEEIKTLTNELNAQLNIKNKVKENIVQCYNDIHELEETYKTTEAVYNELQNDAKYIEENLSDEEIICPTCGIIHKNNIQNRFHIYSDIEECKKIIQSYYKKRAEIETKLNSQSKLLNELDGYIDDINYILNKKREDISFNEVILSEGSKSILEDMKEERNYLQNKNISLQEELNTINAAQRKITKNANEITKDYLFRLSKALRLINVNDIAEKDLNKFKPSFSSGGNDLPCAIMAQVFTLYREAAKHSKTVCPPIVMDAVLQQEPSDAQAKRILDYLLTQQPDDSQLIISTTTFKGNVIDGKVISLTDQYSLLRLSDFKNEKDIIDYYENLLVKFLQKND